MLPNGYDDGLVVRILMMAFKPLYITSEAEVDP